MFVRMTFTKTDPAHYDEAIALFNSEEVSGVISQQKGHRFHYLLQSVEDRPHPRHQVGKAGGSQIW